ncbi:MAG: papain-like cysteine protease family protein [Thermomicrobiales bacterium]
MALRVDLGIEIRLSIAHRLRRLFGGYQLATGTIELPVTYAQQEQGNWCWAACCQMLRGLLSKGPLSQCRIADMRFAGNCCHNGSSAQCNRATWPHEAYPAHGIQSKYQDRTLSPVELRAEIDAGRAVQVYYLWNSGVSAHVALVVGYYPGSEFQVYDSSETFGPGRRAYDFIVAAYGRGRWRRSYFDIRG